MEEKTLCPDCNYDGTVKTADCLRHMSGANVKADSGVVADDIERMASAGLFYLQKATELHIQLQQSMTIETVNQWLNTQGLCAVSKADAGRMKSSADYVLMPRALTAENGAKAALIGEFHVTILDGCPDCFEDSPDEASECQACNGAGLVYRKLPIDWGTTKKIYAAAVDACALEQNP